MTIADIYNNKKHLIIFIFIFSFVCSFVFLLFFKNIGPTGHRIPGTDYFDYYKPVAQSIINGEGIVLDGKAAPYIAPGFPVILSAVFSLSQITGINELDLIVLFNIILTAASACFLFFIASELFGRKIGLIASLLWLIYPFNLWFIKNPNTEVPFIFLLYAGIFFYIIGLKQKSIKMSFGAGIILGLSSLVRLISLFLPATLAFLAFFLLNPAKSGTKKIRIFLVLAFIAGAVLAVLPWEFYTLSQGKDFIFLSFRMGTGSIPYSIINLSEAGKQDSGEFFSEDVVNLMERIKSEDLKDKTKLLQFFSREIIVRPIPVLKLAFLKLSRSWYATSQKWWEGPILIIQLFYLITGLGGLVYVFKNQKQKIKGVLILLAVIFYFWLITFFIVSILRYMIPVMGLVIIFSAVFISFFIDKFKRKLVFLK